MSDPWVAVEPPSAHARDCPSHKRSYAVRHDATRWVTSPSVTQVRARSSGQGLDEDLQLQACQRF